jgi:hypothetical protein
MFLNPYRYVVSVIGDEECDFDLVFKEDRSPTSELVFFCERTPQNYLNLSSSTNSQYLTRGIGIGVN